MNNLQPLYHLQRSFEENLAGPLPVDTSLKIDESTPPTSLSARLFDYQLASPIGIAACAIMTSRGIIPLSKRGFSVFTYKTIRSRAHPSHPYPNIVYLDATSPTLKIRDITRTLLAQTLPPPCAETLSISNSLGNPSLAPQETTQDIVNAKQALRPDQVLIVSVYGEGHTPQTLITDFVNTARLAEEAGADVIELNLSCPNLHNNATPLYQNLEIVYPLVQKVTHTIRKPIIAKIGWLAAPDQIAHLLNSLARAGIQGIAAINALSMKVVNPQGKPVFGQRIYSGVSGAKIRPLALNFITQLAEINQKNKLGLTLLGMGGVTQAEHFTAFHQAGAQVALSATGVMWNPNLAIQYHQHFLSKLK
jgi:dihydroorotate dehydrogenase